MSTHKLLESQNNDKQYVLTFYPDITDLFRYIGKVDIDESFELIVSYTEMVDYRSEFNLFTIDEKKIYTVSGYDFSYYIHDGYEYLEDKLRETCDKCKHLKYLATIVKQENE